MKHKKTIVIVAVVVAIVALLFIARGSSTQRVKYVPIDVERVMFEGNYFLREFIVNPNNDTTSQYVYSIDKTIDVFKMLLPNVNISSFNVMKNVLNVDEADVEVKRLFNVFGKDNVIGYIRAVKDQSENISNGNLTSSVMNFEESNHHLSQMIVNLRKYIL